MRTVGIFLHVSRQPNSVAAFITFIANYVSIIPHMLQLAQDHADMLLCKVGGAMTRKGYLYMVFLKVPVPSLLPSQLVEPVSPQPRGQRPLWYLARNNFHHPAVGISFRPNGITVQPSTRTAW